MMAPRNISDDQPTMEDLTKTIAILEKELAQHTKEFNELRNSVTVASSDLRMIREAVALLVTRFEFAPVKLLVYGMTGAILTSVLGAMLAKVIIK